MFGFIKRHPFLTFLFIGAVVANIFTAAFLPLTTALIVAASTFLPFVIYGITMGVAAFINWAFHSTPARVYQAPSELLVPHDVIFRPSNTFVDVHAAPSAPVVDTSATSSDPEPEIELTAKEIQEIAVDLNPLLERLTNDSLTLDTYVNPAIQSDLVIYDITNSTYQNLTESPHTRKPFLSAPFPFSCTKLKALCEALGSSEKPNPLSNSILSNLLSLAICPVTKVIMKDPKIAHLTYTDPRTRRTHDFALICDQTALDRLPVGGNVRLIKRVDWTELQRITTHPIVGYQLETTLAAAPRPMEDMSRAWEAAYVQAKKDFPGTTPPAAPSSSSSTFYQPAASASGYSHAGYRPNW